jgi:hypothetical protein
MPTSTKMTVFLPDGTMKINLQFRKEDERIDTIKKLEHSVYTLHDLNCQLLAGGINPWQT